MTNGKKNLWNKAFAFTIGILMSVLLSGNIYIYKDSDVKQAASKTAEAKEISSADALEDRTAAFIYTGNDSPAISVISDNTASRTALQSARKKQNQQNTYSKSRNLQRISGEGMHTLRNKDNLTYNSSYYNNSQSYIARQYNRSCEYYVYALREIII